MEGISLAPQILFYIGSFPVTNSFLWIVVLSWSIIIVSVLITKFAKPVPGKLQSIFEILLDGAYNFILSIVGDKKRTSKIFPLAFSMFFLILMANLATFIPGQSAFSLKTANGNTPVFRTIIADYSIVFIMTLISIITTQIVAIIVHGPFGYIAKFINLSGIKNFFIQLFKGKLKLGILAQGLLDLFLGLMDVIGEIAKIISLSFRLFGNMFAAEVLSAVILFLAPFIAPIPFKFLGLLTAIVQAFVFSILTVIFINMASEIEENEIVEQNTM